MKDKQKKPHNKVTFKAYEQHQQWLLPPSLEELIPEGHIVRLVSRAIDGMKLEGLLNAYEGGGASNYHPRMLLKVLVYGYIDRLYSSRRIAKAVSENINFMWLSGMQTPDHNTINRFRKGQLKQTVKAVFAEVLLLLIEEGLVRLEDYHVDGTKIESAANRYTFVGAKRVARKKHRRGTRLRANQMEPGIQALPFAGPAQGHLRVRPRSHRPQPQKMVGKATARAHCAHSARFRPGKAAKPGKTGRKWLVLASWYPDLLWVVPSEKIG